jgi:putative oxidoreductase
MIMSNRIDSWFSASERQAVAPTFLRIALGAVFLAHAYAKAAVFTFPGTVQFFEANDLPGWTAYPVFAIELFGGLALVAGFHARLVALGLIPVMIGALKPHLGNGWMFSNAGGGWEYVAFILVALTVQVILGDGAFALGTRSVARREGGAKSPIAAAH